MIKPYLFIGVGGSGGQTLRYLHREMERRVRSNRAWAGELPSAWRFLHIDVPATADGYGQSADIPEGTLAGADVYLPLTRTGATYESLEGALRAGRNWSRSVQPWLPDASVGGQIWLGAKQTRAVGRVVGLAKLDAIREQITERYNDLHSPEVIRELQEFAATVGSQAAAEPQVVLATSIGGGAGSGVFLDVMEVVKSIIDPNEALSFLYSPEVFESFNDASTMGVAPNSLAAVSELISGFHHTGRLHPAEEVLVETCGIPTAGQGRRTFLQNMLIGTSGSGALRLPSSAAVFRVVGTSLAAFVMNPDIGGTFGSYLTANYHAAVARAERTTESNLPVPQAPFSSFGFARVGLGRHLFNEYAAQRIAAAALLRLRRGHVDDAAPGELVDERAALEERVRRLGADFIDDCRLRELSDDHNQILDALRNFDAVKNEIHERCRQLEADYAGDGDEQGYGKDTGAGHAKRLGVFLGVYREADAEHGPPPRTSTLIETLESRLYADSRNWVREIQPRIVDVVVDRIGTHGFRTASALIDHLISHLRDAAAELRDFAAKNDGWRRKRIEQEMLKPFRHLARKTIGPNHEAVLGAFARFEEALVHQYEAMAERLAATLSDDLVTNMLVPLKIAIDRAGSRLEQELDRGGPDAPANRVAGWPTEHQPSVPPSMYPSENDVVLVDVGDYPSNFEHMAKAQYGLIGPDDRPIMTSDASDPLDLAISEVLTGIFDRADTASASAEPQTLIIQDAAWVADVEQLLRLAGSDMPRRAAFRLTTVSPDEILRRARDWVHNARGPISDHAAESLREFLAPQHPDAVNRSSRFTTGLERALDLARPLITIDPAVYDRVHASGSAEELTHVVSPIPLTREDDAYERSLDVLRREVGSLADGCFDTATDAQSIEIAAFLSIATGIVPIRSLGSSVVSAWNRVVHDSELRARFWQYRRSRRLPSFVPMSRDRQRAFLRGWFTGVIIGHVPPLVGYWEDQPLSVWAPDGWRQFPHHLLGPSPRDEIEVPFALLETFPIVLLQSGQGEDDEWRAYERVADLGSSPAPTGSAAPSGYRAPSAALAEWIQTGRSPDGVEPPVDDEEGRRQWVSDRFAELRSEIARIGDADWDTVVNEHLPSRCWEMADEALAAVDEVIAAVSTSAQPTITPLGFRRRS